MARKKPAKKTGTAAIKTVEDVPVADTAQVADPVADDKPGLGKKICPHCRAKIAARSSTCPACHAPIAPKVKKVVKPARPVAVSEGKRYSTVASNGMAKPAALEAGIRFLKAAGSVEEADKTWAIIREVARAVVTPF
jgi:hypothetical protein